MLKTLKNYIKDGFKEGFSLPLAKDGITGLPSATLWFAYISFLLALAAEVYFIIKEDNLASTSTAIIFWVIAMVFYRMGKLDKVKIDIDDQNIELDGEDDAKS
jgi:hypothetical protein